MSVDIAICDNDKETARDMGNLVSEYEPTAKAEIFLSAEELLACKRDFDIYFLDIKGIFGLDLAREIRKRQPNIGGSRSIIIFVTGYGEYMPDAFDVQAFHYLLKPVNKEKLRLVLEKAVAEIKAVRRQENGYVILKISDRQQKIFLRSILYAESNNKKIILHTVEGAYEVQGTMDSFALTLGDTFYRCHRCYLVNLAQVSSYTKNEIELENGTKILLAYKKYAAFVKAYLAYAKRGGMVNV